ncbi:MAG TPA: PDZ domain-containing protein, partial [Gemmataceae bacterium]|nr:PDZ domain-containing protein [Gemmataceae bacterium]
DRSGLHVVRAGGRPVVESVDQGSPAALVGLQPGDEILRISDRDAAQLKLFSIRKLLCRSGEKIRLTVQRDSANIVLSMVLAE